MNWSKSAYAIGNEIEHEIAMRLQFFLMKNGKISFQPKTISVLFTVTQRKSLMNNVIRDIGLVQRVQERNLEEKKC